MKLPKVSEFLKKLSEAFAQSAVVPGMPFEASSVVLPPDSNRRKILPPEDIAAVAHGDYVIVPKTPSTHRTGAGQMTSAIERALRQEM